ncbi:MAG: HAD-IA family hydrolase [DPANN group archaeon]|nr:HAD-IA family hydrolase [DPANN group archaeon]
MTTAIIFDMDGVLVDISRSLNQAIIGSAKEYCRLRGKKAQFSPQDIQRIKNLPGHNDDWKVAARLASDALGVAVPVGDVADGTSLKHLFEERYLGVRLFTRFYGSRPKRAFPGLIDDEPLLAEKAVLERLRADHPLAIFTGRPRDQALYALDRLGITDLFSAIITRNDVKEGKPSPEGLLRLHELMGFETAYYLGDNAQDDMLAAKAANEIIGNSIVAVGVIPPACPDPDALTELFMKNGAETVLEKADQILDLL